MRLFLLISCLWKSRSAAAYRKTLEKSEKMPPDLAPFPCYPVRTPDCKGSEEVASYRKKKFFYLPEYDELLRLYPIRQAAAEGTTLEQARRVMQWLSEHTFYCGMQCKSLPDDTLTLLRFSYDKGFSHALNCRDKAIVLTDCLAALGMRAITLCFTSLRGGCHIMTHVFLPEVNQWALLDPSFNVTFLNKSGAPMDVFAVQDALWNGKTILYSGYDFNGQGEFLTDAYRNSFLKGTMHCISTWPDNRCEHANKKGRQDFHVLLQPEGTDYPEQVKKYYPKETKWTLIGKEDLLAIEL